MRIKFGPAAMCVAVIIIAAPAHGGWLTIDNPPPSNEITMAVNGVQSLSLPGFTGNATFTLTSISPNARMLLRSYAFHDPSIFSEYPANGLNPVGADQFVIGDVGGAGPNALSGTFNFSGLQGGVLPAGSVFTVLDLDTLESLQRLTGFDSSGQLTSPWLTLVAQFDSNGSISGLTSSFPTFAFSSGAYNFTEASGGDVGVLYFRTTQDLVSVSFAGESNLGPRGYGLGFGVNDVPEPGTFGLAGVACVGIGLLRRRKRAVN